MDSLEQVRKPNPRYQIGSGKTKELVELVRKNHVPIIIFDNELKPVQRYNLAKATGVEVIDRLQLILEIFTKRASTVEANLQIRLARLRYELPRAKERVKLARLEEQPGFRGLGKYEVDLYYETVKRRISSIRDKLKKKQKKRRLPRYRRIELGLPSISLAGYTNAGKSSLFNLLAKEKVPVTTDLFTTLSTKTSAVRISKRKILLTDTVGFIDRLPLTLIQAFRSTLEETIFSDLILLIVDVGESNKEIQRKLNCCRDTIQKIGATGIPIITVLNKIDLLRDGEALQRAKVLKNVAPNPVFISALAGINIDLLKQEIANHLEKYVQASISFTITDESMSFVSWLFDRAEIRTVTYKDDSIEVVFESVPWFVEKVKGRVEQLRGTFNSSLKF